MVDIHAEREALDWIPLWARAEIPEIVVGMQFDTNVEGGVGGRQADVIFLPE
jgi:hypothetical protein